MVKNVKRTGHYFRLNQPIARGLNTLAARSFVSKTKIVEIALARLFVACRNGRSLPVK